MPLSTTIEAVTIGGPHLTVADAELDAFVEKRFGKSLSVRLSANNLLDASKDEFFDKFNTEAEQLARDYKEYELETESAGRSLQLVARWAF